MILGVGRPGPGLESPRRLDYVQGRPMNDAELAMLLDVVRTPERSRATIEDRLRLLEDQRRIADLIMYYGWLCDARRWDELLELYTDDFERSLLGTLEEHLVGKETLREVYERPVLPRKGGRGGLSIQPTALEIRHLIHPPVIRIADDNDHATAVAVYSMAVTSGDGPDLRRGMHEGGYVFEFRREPEFGWRFAKMSVISENARNPLFWDD
jgi:hypothetical protein